MGRTTRGFQDVRTLAGSAGMATRPRDRHALQFRIGCLELERTRRLKERTSALDRIGAIDARLGEIDGEIRGYHATLGYAGMPGVVSLPGVPGGDMGSAGAGAVQVRKRLRYGG